MPRGFANRQSLHRHATGRSPSVRSHYHRAIARLDAALTGPSWWGSFQGVMPWAAQGTDDSDFEDAEVHVEAFVIVSPVRDVQLEIKVWIEFETGKDLANKVKDEMGLPNHARVQLFLGSKPIRPKVQLATQGIVDGTALKAIVSINKALHDDSIKGAVAKWMDPKTRQSVVDEYGDIGDWNTSQVTDMSFLFYSVYFNEDISLWDTGEVKDMSYMFMGAKYFNQPLKAWDVRNVKDMNRMFFGAHTFNQPLKAWDVRNVEDMNSMFFGAHTFNQPLEEWGEKLKKNTDMGDMFRGAKSLDQLPTWYKAH